MQDRQKNEEAIRILSFLEDSDPENTNILYFLASLKYAESCKLVEAAENLARSPDVQCPARYSFGVRKHREDPSVLLSRSQLLRAESVSLLVKVLELQPNNVDALIACAMLARGDEKFDEAQKLLHRALRVDPSSSEARFEMSAVLVSKAVHLFERGLVEDAATKLSESLKFNSDNADSFYQLGLVYTSSGNISKACESYLRAIELRSTHVEALTNLGLLYRSIGDLESSLDCLRRAHEMEPSNEIVTRNLSTTLSDIGTFLKIHEGNQVSASFPPLHLLSFLFCLMSYMRDLEKYGVLSLSSISLERSAVL